MSAGKSATHQHTAAKDLFPLLKEIGHRGRCIAHYCFDCACQQAAEEEALPLPPQGNIGRPFRGGLLQPRLSECAEI